MSDNSSLDGSSILEDDDIDDYDITLLAKKTRPDRSTKLKQRKNSVETVVKCSIGSIILGEESDKIKIKSIIGQYVDAFSKRAVLGSINMNKLIKELFDGVPDSEIKNVKVPEFSQSMVRQLMLGLEKCTEIDQSIQSFFDKNQDLLSKVLCLPRFYGDRNIYCSGSKKYLTNFNNYYWMNISKWIKKFIYSETVKKEVAKIVEEETKMLEKKIKEEAPTSTSTKKKKPTKKELKEKLGITINDINRCLLYEIHSWDMKAELLDLKNKIEKHSPWLIEQLQMQHEILGRIKMTDAWMKKTSTNPTLVRYCVFINRYLQAENDKWKPIDEKTKEPIPAKKIPIAPINTIKSHFITIDTSVLHALMKEAGLISRELNYSDFDSISMDHWMSLFNIDSLVGKGKTFTRTIDTDGVSISVHYMRPKTVLEKSMSPSTTKNKRKETPCIFPDDKKATELPNKYIIGCDPGRAFIYYMVHENKGSKKDDVFKLSRNQYYNDAGMIKARKNTNSWLNQEGVKEARDELSNVSSKGDSLSDFIAYMEVVFKHWETNWNEMTKKRWANQRLRLYGGKKRVFANFFNRIKKSASAENKSEIYVAYGSAKFASGGKGEISVPTSGAFKECKNHTNGKTFIESEFRTTRIWNEDKETLLKSVVSKKTGQKIRGLLWCDSTINRKSKYVNRDLNAAKNILHCFMLPKSQRPQMLSRVEGTSTSKALPSMAFGKNIIC